MVGCFIRHMSKVPMENTRSTVKISNFYASDRTIVKSFNRNFRPEVWINGAKSIPPCFLTRFSRTMAKSSD